MDVRPRVKSLLYYYLIQGRPNFTSPYDKGRWGGVTLLLNDNAHLHHNSPNPS